MRVESILGGMRMDTLQQLRYKLKKEELLAAIEA